MPSLVPSSSSLLQQMSASLQSSGQAMSANSAVGKFPELSITKHEPRMENPELQIIQKRDTGIMGEQSAEGYNSCRQEADIQEQINMLRTMPDFMRMQTPNIQEEEAEASGEEMEDEENNIGQKVGTLPIKIARKIILCLYFRAQRFIQELIIAGSQGPLELQFTVVFTWVTWTPA